MKRRNFLAAATLLSLVGGDAWAVTKKKPPAKPVPAKKPVAGKAGGKKAPPGKKPSGPVAHTPETPVTEAPPPGSSASRLPPVKAPEPPAEWRTWEVTTSISLKWMSGPTRLWLPLPLNQDTLYQRTLGHEWSGNPGSASLRRLPDGDLEVFRCEWKGGVEPQIQITTTVTTADRHFDVTKRTVAPEREDILRRNLQASKTIPNDDAVHRLGERIIGRVKDPVAQAKAIYDWVIDNTIFDPAVAGVGSGDVRQQFDAGQYGGKSADINGLFVALCRAIGIPARCVYGLRVGPSRLFKSLGIAGDQATSAQHVRAEFYVPGYGWIPVDPADVRRVIALEGISERDGRLGALRRVLFGVWEMNWLAYNVGNDVPLPGGQGTVPFLVQPYLETGDGTRDIRDLSALPYTITARRAD